MFKDLVWDVPCVEIPRLWVKEALLLPLLLVGVTYSINARHGNAAIVCLRRAMKSSMSGL